MSVTFNQFQKELRDRGIDPKIGYFLSMIFEQQLEVGKQVDMCAKVLSELANTVGNVVELHNSTQSRLQELNKAVYGHVEGVTVTSEPGKGN